MIIWANGSPGFPVYKAFYVFCGSWNPASYLVGRKFRLSISEFFIGAALVPPEAVQAVYDFPDIAFTNALPYDKTQQVIPQADFDANTTFV
ncbi:uncharacterized protein N7487_002266 [Penicillium crustosum]|uniref:uncharacterized protein n=1 Tax=Penicillium crustosum TaxID=36656 RepID=UPI00239C17AD|nr:uncharacterized protein N7487_002266 [Penicillium crustosum]KAJ5418716.1 hypothetical protein N7487_002266 [Penicillium crustosum]